MKSIKFLMFIALMSIVLFTSCVNDLDKPIPDRHSELSEGTYNKYISLLNAAYESNSNFDVAIQLANLKTKSPTYQYLSLAINEDQSICDKLYEWYWLYDRHSFGVNILMLDTSKYKGVLNVCDQLNQLSSYASFAQMKDEEERKAEANKPKEDSTHYDRKLVAELEEIRNMDQAIRTKINDKNISKEEKERLYKEMEIVDSINLEKIDRIFNKYGYPGKSLVGKEGNFTPALVIHHSNSLNDRYKYLPFLENAVKEGLLFDGTLDMIKRRIESMELDANTKKSIP